MFCSGMIAVWMSLVTQAVSNGSPVAVVYSVGIVKGESHVFVRIENRSSELLVLSSRRSLFKVDVKRVPANGRVSIADVPIAGCLCSTVDSIAETANGPSIFQVGSGAWRMLGPRERLLILVPIARKSIKGEGDGYSVHITYRFSDSEALLKAVEWISETTFEKLVRAGFRHVSGFSVYGDRVADVCCPRLGG